MTNERIIELLEIEKECVLRNCCGECNRACHICELVQDDTELHEMYTEVIALLKAQEPHVMSLEEAKSAYVIEYRWSGKMREVGSKLLDINVDPLNAEYGKIYRVWTSRPTDEQREATPWN